MSNKILSCDWGTTSFRLRLIDVDTAAVMHEVKSFDGVNAVHNEWLATKKNERVRLNFYRSFIQSQIEKLNVDVSNIIVIISGMASSTIGMKELPYGKLPFKLSGNNLNIEKFDADSFCKNDILLVSGLQTDVDVMRGEETLLLGCNIEDDVLVIFPGTHSKHIVVKNNIAVNFKTYMTGEFFELLSSKSVLSKSVTKNAVFHDTAFTEGVKDGKVKNILNASFQVRTNQLFKKYSGEKNYYYLSGLLIGNELSDLLKEKHQSVIIVANDELQKLYSSALEAIDASIKIIQQNADEALINAHILIYNYT